MLIERVEELRWTARGVANLRNFNADNNLLDLFDGITIRVRSRSDLSSLGFDEWVWERIAEDRHGFGSGSFVLVAEDYSLKQPTNPMMADADAVSVKSRRAIQALRLAAAGSITMGPMWVTRPARFDVGIEGLVWVGDSISAPGTPFIWTEQVERDYPGIYNALVTLEKDGYGTSPGNLAIALNKFGTTYDSWRTGQDSQILDCCTALEALLGNETEIAFRLSFRVACLLGTSDDHRRHLFKLMKRFYDLRSRIVHGGKLDRKQEIMLGRGGELQSLVRQLLRAFVGYAAAPNRHYSKEFWNELELALASSTERERLRTLLGLS